MPLDTLVIAQRRLMPADPHDCTDIREERSLHEAMFDALVGRGPSLQIEPRLAQAWTVSADSLTWTFSLREGITFHNGEPFDSGAVEYTMRRMGRPDVGAALGAPAVYAQYLRNAQTRIVGQHTIEITTNIPNGDLLDIIVDAYIVPPEASERAGADFKYAPVGTGAYQFWEWAPGDRFVARENHSYWRGAPTVKSVEWRLVPESTERVTDLKRGTVDIATGLGPADIRSLATDARIEVGTVRDPTCIVYLFNCTGPLRDRRVRQAINYAIDKQGIVTSILHGAGYVLSGFISPALMGFNPDVGPYPFNPQRALELLAESGYSRGLSLTVDTPTSSPSEAVPLTQAVCDQLGAIGIETQIRVEPDRAAYANRVRLKQIGDMCCFDSSPLSTYRVLREKISSVSQGVWWQGYSNARVDELIAAGNSVIDPEVRAQLYRECFRLVHDDPPWLFLYNPQSIYAAAGIASGWRPRLDGCVIPQNVGSASGQR